MRVYDDFAHHPTAIATTLAGLRRRMQGETGGGRILAVIEPRSNTMKLGVMKAQLPSSLEITNHVICNSANLGWDAAEALAPLGDKVSVVDDLDRLIEQIATLSQADDRVLVMSNGGFGGIHGRLLDMLGRV